jgi:hypothetical protein
MADDTPPDRETPPEAPAPIVSGTILAEGASGDRDIR